MKEDYIYIDKSSIENPFSNDTSEIRLRDHFAAMAMQGLIVADVNALSSNSDISRYSYEMADAMLKEREK